MLRKHVCLFVIRKYVLSVREESFISASASYKLSTISRSRYAAGQVGGRADSTSYNISISKL